MRNESLIEWVFRNEKNIRQAVYEKRNDDCHVSSGKGGNLISNPTETQAIKNATEIKMVSVPSGLKGAMFKLSNPERWIKVCDRVKEKYGGKVQGELLVLHYKEGMSNKDVIETLRLSRSLFFMLKSEIIVFAEGVATGYGIYLER